MTALVLLLLVNWAAIQARQVLNNENMDGCNSSFGPLTGWTGTGGCSGNQPCSAVTGGTVQGGPTPGPPTDCTALWHSGYSAYSQTLSLSGSEAPGLYDFQAFLGCYRPGPGPGICTFSLTIDGTPISLIGTTAKPAVFPPDTFTPLTAEDISIINPTAVVSINCVPTGGAQCFVTQATLTFVSLVIADPHFVGLDGQKFDIIGQPHSAYSLLSDKDVMVCVFPLSVSFSFIFGICLIKRLTSDPHHLFFILCRSTVSSDSSKWESTPSSLVPL